MIIKKSTVEPCQIYSKFSGLFMFNAIPSSWTEHHLLSYKALMSPWPIMDLAPGLLLILQFTPIHMTTRITTMVHWRWVPPRGILLVPLGGLVKQTWCQG